MFGNGKRNRLFSRDLIWNDAPCDVDVFSAAEKISLPYGKSKKKNHQTFLAVLAVGKWGNESN